MSSFNARKAARFAKNNAISSDDPEAISKLETKLAECQAAQEKMKAANAYYRKHKTMKGYPGLDDSAAVAFDEEIRNAYSWAQQPYPSYSLTNNNANIRRIEKRIEELRKRDKLLSADGDEGESPAINGWEFDGGSVVMNAAVNRIQILFDEKPNEELRAELKRNGFIWAPSQGAWQRHLNGNGLYAVKRIKFIQPKEGDEQ
jgi:hypothetical protein